MEVDKIRSPGPHGQHIQGHGAAQADHFLVAPAVLFRRIQQPPGRTASPADGGCSERSAKDVRAEWAPCPRSSRRASTRRPYQPVCALRSASGALARCRASAAAGSNTRRHAARAAAAAAATVTRLARSMLLTARPAALPRSYVYDRVVERLLELSTFTLPTVHAWASTTSSPSRSSPS